jgi:hypothetical protein
MSHHDRAGLQLRSNRPLQLALDPWRPDRRSRFSFQSAGKIDDGIAQVARLLPRAARGAGVGRKKSEVNALELFGANTLDKAHFVADSFELAQGLVVIEQADIDDRKIAVAQNFRDFFAQERSGTNDRDAVKIGAA